IVLLGRHDDLLGESRQHTDQIHLGRVGQEGGVNVFHAQELHAGALQLAQDGADAGVGVLDVIDGVVVVGLDGLVQIEVDAAAGLVHIKEEAGAVEDRKSTRLNSSHVSISYAVFCLKKKNK